MEDRDIKIFSLNERPGSAEKLADWTYGEWYSERNIPYAAVRKMFMERARSERFPVSFVAFLDGEPAGMATLKNDELWSRPDLNPWLSTLYVEPAFRRMGIGSGLVGAVLIKAGEIGFGKVYLFLGGSGGESLAAFYEKRGWIFCGGAIDNDGRGTRVYSHGS
ncbi:MAG: GNAT family N-acetyltransferase [Spirochaetes bacterium]|nr:GNAT family N-acetyltransferase [Spirochaetota bacterium]